MIQEEQSMEVSSEGIARKEEHPIMASKMRKAQRLVNGVVPHIPGADSLYPVTDLKYYMNGFLKSNLEEVPKFLKKAWDCVIIVSGNGKVRIGKSTIAMQIAYFIAWLLNEKKKKRGEIKKDEPVPFNIEHVVFDPDELMKTAEKLPRNSVIVYDEGRAGLDSARAMENINKAMQDFFQECGQYGHVIVIVLPDFFKLNETIAVPRSLFLINCYTDKNYNRGYFSFYSEGKKELLYIIGKKRWGNTARYMAVEDNFHGKFANYFPVQYDLYTEKKKKALSKRRKTRLEIRWHMERDFAFWIMRHKFEMTYEDIAKEMKKFPDMKITSETVERAIMKVRKRLEVENYELPDEDEV